MKTIYIACLLATMMLLFGCANDVPQQEELQTGEDELAPVEGETTEEEVVEETPESTETTEEEVVEEAPESTETTEEEVVEEAPESTETTEEEVVEETSESTETTEEEVVEEVSLNCPGTNPASGNFDVEVGRFGITKGGTAEPIVEMDKTSGTVSFSPSEPFEAQSGINWYQYEAHIYKGDCNGELLTTLVFKWEDGDQDKSKQFDVPQEGCYCLKIADEDLSVNTGSISMTSGDEFTLDFSTE